MMLPTGMYFTSVSEKAMEAHKTSTLPKHYLSWTVMQGRKQKSFVGVLVLFVFAAAPPALAERFAFLVEGLCRSVARQSAGGRIVGPLIVLIWSRLRRIGARFAGLVARVCAGTLPVVASARRRPVSRRPACPPRSPRLLPRRFAWLLRLAPEAGPYHQELHDLLSQPEMAALVAGTPQMGRILRPLCRMLGVKPVPGLLLPRRAARAPAVSPAQPSRAPPRWLQRWRGPGRLHLPDLPVSGRDAPGWG
jgi:hypothetical protein